VLKVHGSASGLPGKEQKTDMVIRPLLSPMCPWNKADNGSFSNTEQDELVSKDKCPDQLILPLLS